ncbi:kinase-like protein [Aulographum hederae CBS 113979]|uniref:non-specific serine/threonine protein kinase n=1 Tax=Aulographum hederae CBS 113979 TaxID=1176131 RepID=A0A6G1HCM3_9PEZI|nr:kinase-like protein [Aulographum hederae CBS 113979]
MDCLRDGFIEGVLLDGRFRTISPLNHGSFGMVFKARDILTGGIVALKCLTKPEAAIACPSAIAIDDKSEELDIHRRIGRHPNIVNLIHSFETANHTYLVLEFCPNGDLYESIRSNQGPLQTEHVKDFVMQLVDAIEFMHSKGIAHRDIKPENIFLTKDGSMKVGDFGLATMEAWTFEAAVGSDRYMAPEQYDPASNGYSPTKADIWAIGICLLNILFSRNPFATPSGSDPLFNDFFNDKQSLFDVFPKMSQDTFEVLRHSLAIDPNKRSLSAVKDALNSVVSFTVDDESLDEFCSDSAVPATVAANREPLRTPSINTPQMSNSGAFPWAKALAMSPQPPVRQLSAIPEPEGYSDDRSSGWFSKPDTASIASFVDSGLGLSYNSFRPSNLKIPEFSKFKRSEPVPISGSLPAAATRPKPISSMSQLFKKRDMVSKSWSDLWDEEEEEQQTENEPEHMFVKDSTWDDDVPSGRTTPRVGLSEMKNPSTANNSRSRAPAVVDERVSEHTGFIFDDFHSSATLHTPHRYSPPSKRSILDKWSVLGDRRRGQTPKQVMTAEPTNKKVTHPMPSPLNARKRSRASSWRRNNNASPWVQHHGNDSTECHHLNEKKEDWSMSKDWRQHGNASEESLGENGWVWRHGLHL